MRACSSVPRSSAFFCSDVKSSRRVWNVAPYFSSSFHSLPYLRRRNPLSTHPDRMLAARHKPSRHKDLLIVVCMTKTKCVWVLTEWTLGFQRGGTVPKPLSPDQTNPKGKLTRSRNAFPRRNLASPGRKNGFVARCATVGEELTEFGADSAKTSHCHKGLRVDSLKVLQ